MPCSHLLQMQEQILFELRETSRGKENNMVIVNVSPIAYGHVLLVPKLKVCQHQVFTEESLQFAIEVVALSNHRCASGTRVIFSPLVIF